MSKEIVDYQILRTQLLDYFQRVGPYLDLTRIADQLQLTRGQVYRLEGVNQGDLQKIADFCAGLSFNVLEQQVFSKTVRENTYMDRHVDAKEKVWREQYVREQVATEMGHALLNLGHIVEVPAGGSNKPQPREWAHYHDTWRERRWELRLPAIPAPSNVKSWIWGEPNSSRQPDDYFLGVDPAAPEEGTTVLITTDAAGNLRSVPR